MRSLFLFFHVAVAVGLSCTPSTSVDEAKSQAADLFAAGDHVAADACLGIALAALTSELERLAVEADSLRSYRAARRLQPAVGETNGCIIDASGSAVCLSAPAASAAGSLSTEPTAITDCMSEAEASAWMQRVERGEAALEPPAMDTAVVHAAQRHWWGAARTAVNLLRNGNIAVTSEARRVVTELRDEAGAVLTLMRQTKMDEATISCACMWAQGAYALHLNVKFASRLDSPVTVLNVDNEVVHMNATHLSFSGIGRQKPKRYVLEVEFFSEIDPALSTWSFGSVGTIKFVLRKANKTDWKRLTLGEESVKNHRVYAALTVPWLLLHWLPVRAVCMLAGCGSAGCNSTRALTACLSARLSARLSACQHCFSTGWA